MDRPGAPPSAQATLEARLEAERRARLEAEARLDAAERSLAEARAAAQLAGRAKTAFLANMSHEIRTPVAAVMGYANLIAAASGGADSETRDWSRRLQRSAEHLLGLLDDVLDLAKIDAGRLDLHLVPTSPTTLLEEVGDLMEPRAVERGLELTVVSDTDMPDKIRTDPLRLRQILVNLVSNAVKYTISGRVSLHASVRAVPRTALVLEVMDTGVGIAEEDLERLFQPFEQVQQTQIGRHRAGGVGLGLDISRRLARMLGGDITVRSQLGVGSVFTLTLPLDTTEAGPTRVTPARLVTQTGMSRPEENTRLDGRTVLLVDDTDDNRRIVAHFLGQAGARVLETSSLAEAFARLASGASIDLVLTDLQLPDGNGLALVEALRSQGDRRPIVALTADALLETRAEALGQGVDDFIVKPIVGHRLVARVAALVRRDGDATAAPITRRIPAPTPAEVAPSRAEPRPESRRGATSQHARPGTVAPPDVPPALLQKFYSVLAERVYATEDALRSKDGARLKDVAHRVAGAGSAMGHPELTELGRALEAALGADVAAGRWEAIEPLALRFLTAARDAASKRRWLK